MDLRQLRYFVAVAEARHISRAAQSLGIQQPPLSQAIRALEAELGGRLFTRHARGVELTPAGAVLLAESREIIAGLERAGLATRRALSGETGRLSIGFTTSAILHPLVPDVIRAFRAAHSGITLDLQEGNAAELTEAVHHGDLDAGFLRVPVAHPEGLAFMRLLDEELVVVLPIGHRLLAGGGGPRLLHLAELSGEPFILVRRPSAPGIYANVILACREAGFEAAVVAEVAHMLTNINMVAAGLGISIVPASMREINLRQVVFCPIAPAAGLAAPLTLAYPERGRAPMLERFITLTSRLADGAVKPG